MAAVSSLESSIGSFLGCPTSKHGTRGTAKRHRPAGLLRLRARLPDPRTGVDRPRLFFGQFNFDGNESLPSQRAKSSDDAVCYNNPETSTRICAVKQPKGRVAAAAGAQAERLALALTFANRLI
jgi:hypothetical protein